MNELDTLNQLQIGLEQESSAVTAVRVDDPITAIEASLTDFVKDSFRHVEEHVSFEREVEDAIRTQLGVATVTQLMDYHISLRAQNVSEAASILHPVLGAHTAKAKAEIETHQSPNSTADTRIFRGANKDVLQGIVQLNQILQAMQQTTPILVDDTETKKP